MSRLRFKVSSALKDIIGRDLIPDDFIAVFELVKNSFDAHATRVDITFEEIDSNNAKIIIKDDGKGMDYNDLINKWLFLAYSAKKEGTEDLDYRERIYHDRPFAGAKGIGRFSCDKLGKKLKLETTKKNHRTEILVTEWEKFEKNLKDEFIKIDNVHTWKKVSSYSLQQGTVLEISDLRSEWDRPKLLRLKDSLAKLITPTKSRDQQKFVINIIAPEQLSQDANQKDERNKVNGPVVNFIFEALGLKTTKISCSVLEKVTLAARFK